MTEKPRTVRTATFFEQLKAALLHYDDPHWLGTHSPLAAPYFLGAMLHGATPSPTERGLALLAVLEKTLASLWGGTLPGEAQPMLTAVADEAAGQGAGGRYHCLILELNYRRRCFKPAPKSQAEIYNDILHISRPTHDRHLAQAVEALGALLLQRLRPTLRPEQPPVSATLIGRDALLAQLVAALQAGQAVSLTGAGGMGKSTLGAAVTEQWPSPAVFWYTFRPTFNDHLDSLFFALGYFLHQQGASTLWQQLIADGGRLKHSHLALGLVRTDLAALTQQPLLCFDELDFLRPLALDQPNPHHVQLLEFMDSLRTYTPLLLIGQRAFWESDRVYTVDGLTVSQLTTLLAAWAIPVSAEDVARLHAYTAGNPRLVELCGALYLSQPQESFNLLLDALPRSPALLPLWHRLERRLPADERRLLEALSVFRTPAPLDAWGGEASGDDAGAAALQQLLARRLLRQDESGGVALLPALRQIIYAELPVEAREQYHLQAATIRAERGEYTAAAYHLQQADQPEAAVTLWYPYRREEVQRGQGAAALAIFEQISQRRLPKRQAHELALLRSELYELAGQPEKVVSVMTDHAWPADDALTVDAQILWGNALRQQGRSDAALAKYEEGLALRLKLLNQGVQLHILRGQTYLLQRDMAQVRHAVDLARFQVENLQGALYDLSGDYGQAAVHYQAALTIAQALQDPDALANVLHHLALLIGRQQGLAPALLYYEQAMTYYRQSGNLYRLEIVRSNLANTQIQARAFADAVVSARTALHFFQRVGDSVRIAQNASNLAEALVELDHYGEAEHYARLVLEQEEPHSHPYALYTLGTVQRKQQRWLEAELYYSQARKVAELNEDRYLAAYAWEALAESYQALGRVADAQVAVRQAAQGFQQLGIAEKIAHIAQLQAQLDA